MLLEFLSGTITRGQDRFGYLAQDNGESDLFVLPADCQAFGGAIPAKGTRVLYQVGVDEQKGKPKAIEVQPEEAGLDQTAANDIDALVDAIGTDDVAVGDDETGGAPAMELFSGTISRGQDRFGYLVQDSGESDLFILPKDCQAFGGQIPAKGTRVLYSIGVDEQKGQPKAEQVQPEDPSGVPAQGYAASSKGYAKGQQLAQRPASSGMEMLAGTITRGQDRFGYLKPDNGDADLFVLPADCKAFGGEIPPKNTRVLFSVGVDAKKGQPKAENVQPEVSAYQSRSTGPPPRKFVKTAPAPAQMVQHQPRQVPPPQNHGLELLTGTITRGEDRFGYLSQDTGDGDLFVLPGDCDAFGRAIPPKGTRVMYSIGVDPKKGQPKAENVQPEAHFPSASSGQLQAGTITRGEGKFGYLKQDTGENDLFVLPGDCVAFGNIIPPAGTRVLYAIGVDAQKGRPKAEQVQPETGAYSPAPAAYSPAPVAYSRPPAAYAPAAPVAYSPAPVAYSPPPMAHVSPTGWLSGTIARGQDRFGYLVQDNGNPDLFILPADCQAYGGQIPEKGTRVLYSVGVDSKKGQPKAENVQPDPGIGPYAQGFNSSPKGYGKSKPAPQARPSPYGAGQFAQPRAAPQSAGQLLSGTITRGQDRFGYLKPDNGDADLFVLPADCQGFGGEIPQKGTRVLYTIGTDPKKNLPKAENVQPDTGGGHSKGKGKGKPAQAVMALPQQNVPGLLVGTITRGEDRFGYLQQDDGQPDLFVLPGDCLAFGKVIPAKGTRVLYSVGIDSEKGKPKAENVQPVTNDALRAPRQQSRVAPF